MAKIGILLICVGLIFMGCLFMWPTLALIGYMSINLTKPILVTYMPFMSGFWGYIIDAGFAAIAILAMIKNNLTKEAIVGKIAPYFVWVCIIILALWVLVRFPASRDPELAKKKVLIFSVFDTLAISLGILSGRTKNGQKKVVTALMLVGAFTVIGTLAFGQAAVEWEGGSLTLGFSSPLVPADMAAILIIVTIGFWLAKRTAMSAMFAFAATVLSASVFLFTGIRGPLFLLPPVLLVMLYFYRQQRILPAITVVALLFVSVIFVFRIFRGEAIIQTRFDPRVIISAFQDRVIMAKVSLAGWLRSPILGNGPGDFGFQMAGEILTKYPHNLLLEVLNELGVVGFVFFAILLYSGLRGIKLLSRSGFESDESKTYSIIIYSCFLYEFFTRFKGGGYAGSHMLYFFWGTSIGMTQLNSLKASGVYEYEEFYREELTYA